MKYDVVVIGGGSGGLVTAAGAANFEINVALIEKEELGGDCLHYGCVPSKTLIKSAKVAHQARNSDKYGLDINVEEVDMSKVSNHVQDVINTIQEHDSKERFESLGVDVIYGSPEFVSENQVKVDDEIIEGEKFVIATGSKAFTPPIEGLDEVDYLTNESIFSLDELPEKLAIVGGGPIGSEMAQAFSRLGSDVTIFEHSNRILSKEDEVFSQRVAQIFEKEGITIYTGARVEEVSSDDRVLVTAECSGEGVEERFDEILIATGQRPNVRGLNLDKAGIEVDDRGSIEVDKYMRTSQKHIFACGDVVGPYQFTHMAEHEAKTIVWNLFFPFKREVDYSVVPWTTFIDPELAHVGMSAEDGRKKGFDVYTLEGSKVDRFLTESYDEGLAQVVIKDGFLKGATLLLPNAGEVIHEFILAVKESMKVKDVSQMIHVYPTVSQANKKVLNKFMSEKYLTDFTKKLARFFFKLS